MTDKTFDPWSFSSGLTERYTGKVEDAYFGFNASYMDGTRCVLELVIQTDEPDLGEGGKVTELYPCGDGWEPADKGARLVREDGNSKPLNQQSGVALLVSSAVEAGAGDYLKRDGGTPFQAGIWKGLEAEFARKSFEFQRGSEKQTYTRMLVEKYLGDGGGSAKASAPAKETPAETASTNGGGTLDAKTKAKLKVLAKEVKAAGGDHDSFVERAFTEVDGVMDNQVAEDAVMAGGEGSLFASA